MSEKKLSYEELEKRLIQAEELLMALQNGKINMVISDKASWMKRLKSVIDENERLVREWEMTFNSLDVAIWILDNEQRLLRSNKAAEELFAMKIKDMLGRYCFEIVHGTKEPHPECPFLKMKKSLKYECIELPYNNRWLELSLAPILDEKRELKGCIHIIHDISLKKKEEVVLQASERRYRAIVEAANDAIITIDSAGRIVSWNKAAERIFGYSKVEAMNMDFSILFPPDLRKHMQEIFAKAGTRGELYSSRDKIFEGRALRKDGSEFKMEHSFASWRDEKEVFSCAIVRDISERLKSEEEKERLHNQLLQAQKMEAIGLLAGGIAHDFNNVLAAIIGYASFLKMKMKKDDPLLNYVDQILSASERASNLARNLLAFSRKQTLQLKTVRINDLISNILKLLQRILGEDIQIETIYTGREILVMVDTGQIEQVLLNLAANSRDAMPHGGKITISTDVASIDKNFLNEQGYGEIGEYALITFTDTGCGMDKEIQKRIFEPFFTTKEVGKGTGLGLSTAYGIIKQHKGYIECFSEPGIGTTFKIYLPLISGDEKIKLDRKDLKMEKEIQPGSETILVAEDDEAVRNLIINILRQYGYTVLEAKNGEEALKVFQKYEETIDLLLLDLIMPFKSGKEVYEEISKITTKKKAIFISGYPKEVLEKQGILEGDFEIILKPVSTPALLQKIRKVLDQK